MTPETKNSFRIKRTSNVNIAEQNSNKNIGSSHKSIPEKGS